MVLIEIQAQSLLYACIYDYFQICNNNELLIAPMINKLIRIDSY